MNAPLRILHVAAPARTGGLESVLVHLASGLRDRGHDVQVASVLAPGTEEGHPIVAELELRGVPVHSIVVGTRDYLGERNAIRQVMRQTGAQILHTHGFRPDVVDGGIAKSLKGAHVMTLHGFIGGSRRGRLYEWLQIQAARRADAVIAVSAPIVERLARHGIARQVHLARNAVAPATDAFSREEARGALGLPADGLLVGWVGRVSHEKGPDLFVRALAEVPDVIGVMIGDGPELENVRALALASGIESRLHLTGQRQSARRYLAAFDVLALTSRTEGTPMILLEAMWAGVPIVATVVGGVPHMTSTAETMLCEPRAPAIAAAIRGTICGQEVSPAARAGAENAKSRVAVEFSYETWTSTHELAYRSVIR